jgi:predicted DNA-binding protein YlxM (UPF0122 family)
MAGKGNYFTDDCVRRIIALLATDMTMSEIAERMCCSRSSIVSINRKFQVRAYAGRRTAWEPSEVRSTFQNPC